MAPEYTADNTLLRNEIGGYAFSQMPASIGELYAWYASRERDIDSESIRFDE
jgi:hypothetical protein